jgi:hypothetical protein
MNPGSALAANPRLPVVFDLVVTRPLGFAALVVSTTSFIVLAPFMWVVPSDGRYSKAFDTCIREPAKFVFADPIGSH